MKINFRQTVEMLREAWEAAFAVNMRKLCQIFFIKFSLIQNWSILIQRKKDRTKNVEQNSEFYSRAFKATDDKWKSSVGQSAYIKKINKKFVIWSFFLVLLNILDISSVSSLQLSTRRQLWKILMNSKFVSNYKFSQIWHFGNFYLQNMCGV